MKHVAEIRNEGKTQMIYVAIPTTVAACIQTDVRKQNTTLKLSQKSCVQVKKYKTTN